MHDTRQIGHCLRCISGGTLAGWCRPHRNATSDFSSPPWGHWALQEYLRTPRQRRSGHLLFVGSDACSQGKEIKRPRVERLATLAIAGQQAVLCCSAGRRKAGAIQEGKLEGGKLLAKLLLPDVNTPSASAQKANDRHVK
eukprot:EG_transcript_14879